jgi:hypothetical protein
MCGNAGSPLSGVNQLETSNSTPETVMAERIRAKSDFIIIVVEVESKKWSAVICVRVEVVVADATSQGGKTRRRSLTGDDAIRILFFKTSVCIVFNPHRAFYGTFAFFRKRLINASHRVFPRLKILRVRKRCFYASI